MAHLVIAGIGSRNTPFHILVVYWNPAMKTTGGTAHALAVARAQAPDAELVNMAKVTLLGTIERIDNALQRVLGSRS